MPMMMKKTMALQTQLMTRLFPTNQSSTTSTDLSLLIKLSWPPTTICAFWEKLNVPSVRASCRTTVSVSSSSKSSWTHCNRSTPTSYNSSPDSLPLTSYSNNSMRPSKPDHSHRCLKPRAWWMTSMKGTLSDGDCLLDVSLLCLSLINFGFIQCSVMF